MIKALVAFTLLGAIALVSSEVYFKETFDGESCFQRAIRPISITTVAASALFTRTKRRGFESEKEVRAAAMRSALLSLS